MNISEEIENQLDILWRMADADGWIDKKSLIDGIIQLFEKRINSRLEELEQIIKNSTRMGDTRPFNKGAYTELEHFKEMLK